MLVKEIDPQLREAVDDALAETGRCRCDYGERETTCRVPCALDSAGEDGLCKLCRAYLARPGRWGHCHAAIKMMFGEEEDP